MSDNGGLQAMKSIGKSDAGPVATLKIACFTIPLFFVIGLVLGLLAHLVFPWMIGNMQRAIQTKSFIWNKEQAASDTAFVMKLMINIIQRSTVEIGTWVALLIGLPIALLASVSQAKVSQSMMKSSGCGVGTRDEDASP